MRPQPLVLSLALILSSCGGGETVETTPSLDSTSTTATATTIAPTTTPTAEPSTTASASTTTPVNESTTGDVGPEAVVTAPNDPALERGAWLGVVLLGHPQEALPPRFQYEGGQCLDGPESDGEPCSYVLDFAQAVDLDPATEQWLMLFERLEARDQPGEAEREVVDALYIAFPSGRGLFFHRLCYANHSDGYFGVGKGDHCSLVRPLLRAWRADWQTETITEVTNSGDVFCEKPCD